MNPLLLIGIGCIIAAVAGGGLKLLGVEIQAVGSVIRQALLAGIGIALLLSQFFLHRGDGRPDPVSLPSGVPECYGRLFEGIPTERLATLEEGGSRPVIRQDQPKAEPVGVMLTESGRPVGALRFQFLPDGDVFKIQSVADAGCRPVEEFSNDTRPGSPKNTLLNHDALRVRFGDHFYTARLGAGATLEMNFRRQS